MRKWLILLLMLWCVPALADSSDDDGTGPSGQWAYVVDYYGRASLTDWRWETLPEIPDVVEVPAEIDGHKVVAVRKGAFTTEGVGGFTILLPDSITLISGGFEDCGASRIVLGNNMNTVDAGSFAGCCAEVVLTADSRWVVQHKGFLVELGKWNEYARLLYVNPSAKGAALPEVAKIDHHALDNWVTGDAFLLPEAVQRIGYHEYDVPCANPAVIRTAKDGGQMYEYIANGEGATLINWLIGDEVPERLVLPDTLNGLPLTALGDNVFNTSMTNIDSDFTLVIPEGVRTCTGDPFLCCHDAVRIEFPSTFVGDLEGCFSHVTADIDVAQGNPRYAVERGYLIDRQHDTLIYAPLCDGSEPLPVVRRYGDSSLCNWGWRRYSDHEEWPEPGEDLTLTIPEGVEELGSYLIFGAVHISKVVLPDSLTTLERYTFLCTSVAEVQFGTGLSGGMGLTHIPEACFAECGDLLSVTLPENIVFVGYFAFGDVTEVHALNPDCRFETLTECIERIGDDALYL